MGSRVVLNCSVCGAEKFCEEEDVEVIDEESGQTTMPCERCERHDLDNYMYSSDWSV